MNFNKMILFEVCCTVLLHFMILESIYCHYVKNFGVFSIVSAIVPFVCLHILVIQVKSHIEVKLGRVKKRTQMHIKGKVNPLILFFMQRLFMIVLHCH